MANGLLFTAFLTTSDGSIGMSLRSP
jgi:hypothetical protein